jgi:hypothetical protein
MSELKPGPISKAATKAEAKQQQQQRQRQRQMRGSLHCAAHDETVSGFGRDDAIFSPVESRAKTAANGKGRSKATAATAEAEAEAEAIATAIAEAAADGTTRATATRMRGSSLHEEDGFLFVCYLLSSMERIWPVTVLSETSAYFTVAFMSSMPVQGLISTSGS